MDTTFASAPDPAAPHDDVSARSSPADAATASRDMAAVQLGARLRRARLASSLTLEDLAERADVSVPTIRRAERGVRPPRMDTLRKLAVALDISIGMLLADTHASQPPDPSNDDMPDGLLATGD